MIREAKPLLYDISLLHTVVQQKTWWHEIDDNVILSGIPMEHQLSDLKALGVTHVLTLLEDFELEPGIIRPITPSMWQASGIIQSKIDAPDFFGVDPSSIKVGVNLSEWPD